MRIIYDTYPGPLPQLASKWNDLLNEITNFSGKATFGIIMSLSNHLKDLINCFINRKSAIKNTKLTLEALWNIIATTSCKGVKLCSKCMYFVIYRSLRNTLFGDVCNLTSREGLRDVMYNIKHHSPMLTASS